MRGWTALAAMAMLAGCNGQPVPEAANVAATATPAPGGYIAKVLALPPRQLNGVLYRAIDDAKQPCQGIVEATRQADRKGKPVWAVRCVDGSAWLIALGDDGMADVTGIKGTPGG
ncbi:hypothetical protein LPN01_01710 [Sphingomonas sp. A2-49]|uniref:hypothetical protein n=1 Tax=Sphingomonas sp. A2-49 TaxID=1391375 RepID=UPI0021D267D8|nr:hypothetical protein [Sphingomonas sp. A2-49]MCU6452789.1 hypothetical protein [Sphingomonas sp. A2-49]